MTKTRTVLLVSNHAEIVGGGEISLLSLLSGLDRAEWAPVAVVPDDGEVGRRCRALGVPTHVIPLPPLRRVAIAGLKTVLALRRLVRTTGAALMHANGSRAMFYAGLTGWLEDCAVLWHIRVADRDLFLDRLLAVLATRIVVTSEAVRDRLAWHRSAKIRRVYNGVDLARFTPRPAPQGLRKTLQIPEDAPVVLSIGRFVLYKGYDRLLEAAKIVQSIRPDVHWLLVGDGELKPQLLEQLRRLGLQTTVQFPGWREDIADLLALSNVFALPSLAEHFGRVLIEAMAMAKPVVATNAGGVPEIVVHGETGLLVPPAHPEPFARAVLRLLDDPPLAVQLGDAGRRRVERQFSLRQHVEGVEGVYAECV